MSNNSIWPWLDPLSGRENSEFCHEAWPKISIVTPNFNYSHLIEGTIRSVLVQNYPNLEYIIIDDGSTDGSVEVIERYESKLSYFEHHKNQGQYPTINKGFSKATGEIYGWINSDDIYLPWTLRSVGSIFAQFPEVDWIVGNASCLQDGVIYQVSPLTPFPREMIRAGLFHGGEGGGGWIQQESCFWRRSLWEKAGVLRTDLRYAADYELWTRFAKYADLYSVSAVLGGFTYRGSQNRSRANSGPYMEEVRKVEVELRADPKSPEARIAKTVAIFTKTKDTFGVNKLARRLLPINRLRGPILNWNFTESRYRIMQRNYF